jgi:hypothetical protein
VRIYLCLLDVPNTQLTFRDCSRSPGFKQLSIQRRAFLILLWLIQLDQAQCRGLFVAVVPALNTNCAICPRRMATVVSRPLFVLSWKRQVAQPRQCPLGLVALQSTLQQSWEGRRMQRGTNQGSSQALFATTCARPLPIQSIFDRYYGFADCEGMKLSNREQFVFHQLP